MHFPARSIETWIFPAVLLCLAAGQPALADPFQTDTARGDALLAEYFQHETEQIASATLADVHTLEDWEAQKSENRRRLFEMLGLDPLEKKGPLCPVVTGRVEHEDFIVEKLHFQSRPGLFVTANLYLPRQQNGPAPAVLYVCGHARAEKDGVSFGNKTAYQHHPAWFARHGYVCLTIDTLQLGEIEGLHHGTYREGMFWWNSRGYTPAGVEALNCIRSLDYLESRPEVDAARIGVTGRSGGGAYSWWVAALDDRIQVAVPVAGITSLKNHVIDGCIEGHCDCMYMVNTYRWDFPMIAALVAPRPLLISNTDKDSIFPLDGVYQVYVQTRKIYELYGAADKLGLHICEGPHEDTQQLRIHAFQWMNRWLKGEEPLIEEAASPFFEPDELRVFQTLPADEKNSTIHETFVPRAAEPAVPDSVEQWRQMRDNWMHVLREQVFRGWTDHQDTPPLDTKQIVVLEEGDYRFRVFEFSSQQPYRLPLYVVTLSKPVANDDGPIVFRSLGQTEWVEMMRGLKVGFPDLDVPVELSEPLEEQWTQIANQLKGASDSDHVRTPSAWVGFAPRGIGSTEWTRDERSRTHIQRRFVLLGQTLAGMRVWDVRRGLQAAREALASRDAPIHVHTSGDAVVWSLYASLYEPVQELHLQRPPTVNRDGPALLNVSRYLDLAQVVTMATQRTCVRAEFPDEANPWDFAMASQRRLTEVVPALPLKLELKVVDR